MQVWLGNKIVWMLSVCLLLQISLFHINSKSVQAADSTIDLKLEAKSAILMEASTGQVLYEMNADTPLPPASMSKMMTEYIVMERIKSGELKWTDMVTASPYAASVGGSGQLIGKGEQLSVKDMFSAMSIYSANDASVALAERIGGTEENFAKLMNEQAKKLGMSDKAQFINATGLSRKDIGKNAPTTIEGETLMSARDAAILAYNILKDHKEVLEYTKIPSKKLRERDKTPMINYNWMLEGNKDNINFKKYAYQGLDGLKTGSTDDAGYCFTGTAERNGLRLISVVMDTKAESKRFEESRKVLDYGFNNFEFKQLLNANAEIDSLKMVNIKNGVKTGVSVVTKSALNFIVKKGTKPDQLQIKAEAMDQSKLVAPIKKGDKVGTAKVTYEGKEQSVDMIANEDVEKGSWIRLLFRGIKNFFLNLLGGMKA